MKMFQELLQVRHLMIYIIIIVRSMAAVLPLEQWTKKVEKEMQSFKTWRCNFCIKLISKD